MKTFQSFLFRALVVVALGAAGIGVAAAGGGADNHTRTVNGYTMSVVLLPAEPFVSKGEAGRSKNAGAMVDGGGAPPRTKQGPHHPNHHLVVFIKKNGHPVEHADVAMRYTRVGGGKSRTVTLPVTRMWVAGKGRKTTHYGNNADLKPGTYRVQVTVNHTATATFRIKAG